MLYVELMDWTANNRYRKNTWTTHWWVNLKYEIEMENKIMMYVSSNNQIDYIHNTTFIDYFLPILIVFILWRFGDLDVVKYLLLKILCFCGFRFTAKFCLTDAFPLPISDTVKSYSEIHIYMSQSVFTYTGSFNYFSFLNR